MQALERACTIGISSKMFDEYALVLLALLQFDARDSRGLQRTQDHLARRIARGAACPRLQRFDAAVRTVRLMHDRKVAEAVRMMRDLTDDVDRSDMNMEAACHLIALWSRLHTNEIQLDDMPAQVERVALRFCVSRAAMEVLAASAQGAEPAGSIIKAAYATISRIAEKAMEHALKGTPSEAVRLLLAQGTRTRNAKLIDLAGLLVQRHRERIDDLASLISQLQDLERLSVARGGSAVGVREGTRAAGGLRLASAPNAASTTMSAV